MAIPSLPSDDSDGNDWTAAKVNAIYDHLELWCDTRPLFKGEASNGSGTLTLTTSTFVEVSFGISASTFDETPITNVGSFTVASGANADSYYNIEIPETGYYEGVWHVQFATHGTGYRHVQPQRNSANIPGTRIRAISSGSAATTEISAPFAIDMTGGSDDLSVEVWQDSGISLNYEAYLFVKWVQAT